jgi:hypothetical protein
MRVRAVTSLSCAALVAGFCTMHAAPQARAETIVVNDTVTVRDSNIPRPKRGMHMTQVERQFGAPTTRHPAVGGHRHPPITRWDYPEFSVFFEHDIVIHSVVIGDHPPVGEEHPAGDDHPAGDHSSTGS